MLMLPLEHLTIINVIGCFMVGHGAALLVLLLYQTWVATKALRFNRDGPDTERLVLRLNWTFFAAAVLLLPGAGMALHGLG